jgi:hypothetical protein
MKRLCMLDGKEKSMEGRPGSHEEYQEDILFRWLWFKTWTERPSSTNTWFSKSSYLTLRLASFISLILTILSLAAIPIALLVSRSQTTISETHDSRSISIV